MTFSDASENLRATYFALVEPMPRVQVIRNSGYDGCLGEFHHPICNFVVLNRDDPSTLGEVAGLLRSRNYLNVYALHDSAESLWAEPLAEEGMESNQSLFVMASKGFLRSASVQMRQALEPAQRLRVARFMASQFFALHPSDVRDRIARATAAVDRLRLYEVVLGHSTVGAVMLHETGKTVGLYNLCVSPINRGRGIGSDIVRWVCEVAEAEGKSVALQCEARLRGWYESLGFEKIGTLEVYGLAKCKVLDIMK